MSMGPGKYDGECEEVFHKLKADGVLLIVLGGVKGSGFSLVTLRHNLFSVPDVLRKVADDIENSIPKA